MLHYNCLQTVVWGERSETRGHILFGSIVGKCPAQAKPQRQRAGLVAVNGCGEGGRDWLLTGTVCFGSQHFLAVEGDGNFLEFGDGLHDVYLEVVGFRVYDSISIKNKDTSKCKQQMSRQPRGTFRDGLWGRERVARLRVVVASPPQSEQTGAKMHAAGDVGRKDSASKRLAGENGSAMSGV